MPISFNNIPDTVRTPGVYAEIDNSRALKGLVQNPHKALIIGQKHADGNAERDTLYAITSEIVADSYFGMGSILDRMCRVFKKNNPNTELYAIAIAESGAGVIASGAIHFSVALSHNGEVVSTDGEVVNLLINGSQFQLTLTSDWSVGEVNSAMKALINANSMLPVIADTTGTSELILQAICSGTLGNYIDVRFNYYEGQSFPTCFGDSAVISAMEGGVADPSLDDVWSVIESEQFQHIINPYRDATNLTSLETELASRFKPLVDQQGLGYTAMRGPLASCTAVGNSRNSPHNRIMGAYDSPTCPEEWAAAVGAVAADKLNNDPARPLHYLTLAGILPPPLASRFTRAERDALLYDGIATWIVDSGGNVMIERLITTYQTNAVGGIDPSYLDTQTMATLMELRYQFKVRMQNRFLIPRFKLADDSYPVQPGSYVVTPKTIKQEIIALFTLMFENGLIENLEDFITNLIVERDSADVNRVNVLLPPDLINQFRVLAGLIQFIL
jgi:phage tail sheath gpL-like